MGLVRDLYLRYPFFDTMVWQGVTYWAEYMNAKQGGMKYPPVPLSYPFCSPILPESPLYLLYAHYLLFNVLFDGQDMEM